MLGVEPAVVGPLGVVAAGVETEGEFLEEAEGCTFVGGVVMGIVVMRL